jgi:predicted CoA-substrate-specific enzyme activase
MMNASIPSSSGRSLGVDIGSVTVGAVVLGPDGNVVHEDYRFHRGDVRSTLLCMIEDLDQDPLDTVACTSSAAAYLPSLPSFDTWVCFIEAARHTRCASGTLLVVGGERFALLRFDRQGRFSGSRANTSCAAGTGSFLDQQAARLGLAGSAELAERALLNRGVPPKIASRCAVFAKTDLCHAQQSGCSLEEICEGLCQGLARTIVETVTSGQRLEGPVYLAGGVSNNRAVVGHISRLLGSRVIVPQHAHLFGALGAAARARAALARAEHACRTFGPYRREDLARLLEQRQQPERGDLQEPLELRLSRYPDFRSEEKGLFQPLLAGSGSFFPVERDLYVPSSPGDRWEGVLGIDIGSTSTKAVLVEPHHGTKPRVLAGFYTRTAGRPLTAVQAILEALHDLLRAKGLHIDILGVGTTGAGRAFVGRVIGADCVLNEITAHARAAVELEPDVDTIIEIGGQDSKFTVLRDGRVTFCQMNTVCAAGTGSFIEEQAARLGVPLDRYAAAAEGRRAPLTSDRCTVFMERDLNSCLSRGYAVEELLAAILHSVRENYLRKVACEALIGARICFQGATARNRALVAAFEQRLGQPISVSRYCHLTGALGVALALAERLPARTRFRGIDLFKEPISVRGEICELCANHCKIQVAEVQGSTVAYGFLCGRDYEQKKYVGRNRSGFDMLREYRKAAGDPAGGDSPGRPAATLGRPVAAVSPAEIPRKGMVLRQAVRVGIPAALYLLEEIPLWRHFFSRLGIETITSETFHEALRLGRQVSGAEFCAPITALHGHALWLAERCDRVFLPLSIEGPKEEREADRLRYHCYYSQFAPSVVSLIDRGGLGDKMLTPLVSHGAFGRRLDPKNWRARWRTSMELWKALRGSLGGPWGPEEVFSAYREALASFDRFRQRLARVYETRPGGGAKVRVVLTGRPYQVLCPELHKGVPDIFGSLGVEVFWQDMLPRPPLRQMGQAQGMEPEPRKILSQLDGLLEHVHWRYAARILETAAFCALTDGLYPVLMTAFKCAPDAFIAEAFRRLLEAVGKPYLVLQIDDHDFRTGYETRIEAALDAFSNHFDERRRSGRGRLAPQAPEQDARRERHEPATRGSPAIYLAPERTLSGKTLLLPNWEPLAVPLVAARLRKEGIDARVLEEDEASILKAMRLNTGQCIPASAIAQDAADFIERHGLDPARTVLWLPRSDGACNLRMFPPYIQGLFQRYGRGMDNARVYVGDLAHWEISPFLGVDAYLAYWMGGLLRRMACRIRPYELEPGSTDRTVRTYAAVFESAFLGEISHREALRRAVQAFESIPQRSQERRPTVAIFGDLYVRDNEVMNQNLIRHIERCGGEVVTTPYSEYLRIIAGATFRKWLKEGRYLHVARYRLLLALADRIERRLLREAGPFGQRVSVPRGEEVEADCGRFRVRLEHHGESFDNILKVRHLARRHPDLALFVQASPAFCCPSLVTEAMSRRIEQETGVPVVTLTYDGSTTFQNDRITPYLEAAMSVRARARGALPDRLAGT